MIRSHSRERDRPARPGCPLAYARIASTMLPTNARSCGRVGVNPGPSSQHQTTASAAASMSLDLVAIDHPPVAREVEHLRARIAIRARDREQHGVAESAADEHHGLVVLDFGRRAGRPHQHDRLAGRERVAQIGRPAHFEHDHRHETALRDRPTRRSARALPSRAACLACARRATRSSAAGRTGPDESAARGGRRVHDDFDDRRRQPVRRARRAPAIASFSVGEEFGVATRIRGVDARRACATRSDSPASRSPSP